MALFRDSRHSVERELDRRIAEARTGRVIAASQKLDAVLAAGINEGKRVASLGSIAERIAAKKAGQAAWADAAAKRLDALDAREPAVYELGEAAMSASEADLSDLESGMRALSNVPNAISGGSEKG